MTIDVEKIVREHLPDSIHMSLASSRDNKPWVCEVHFAYDEDLNLYFRSLASRRHSEEIADNPNVAGDIVKQVQLGESALGVYFEGTARLLEAGDEQNKAFQCLKDRIKVNDQVLEEAKDPSGHQFYKVTVASWYVFGNLDGNGAQKYELVWGRVS